MKKWGVIAGLAVLFLSGLLIGYFSGGLMEKRAVTQALEAGPGDRERMIVNNLDSLLGLDAQQREQVERIVNVTQARLRLLWAKHNPKLMEVHQERVEQIMKVLDPQQQTRYMDYIRRLEARMNRQKAERDLKRRRLLELKARQGQPAPGQETE